MKKSKKFLAGLAVFMCLAVIVIGAIGFYKGKINGYASYSDVDGGVGKSESEIQNVMMSPPPTPTGLEVLPIPDDYGCTAIRLKWNKQNGVDFKLYKDGEYRRSLDSFVLNPFDTVVYSGDGFLMGNTTYSYQVSAFNNEGESQLTNPVNAATNPCHTKKTLGNLNFSVMLVKFANFPEPFSRDYAHEMIYSGNYSLKRYVEESSYGRQNITGDVYGWYTLPGTTSDYCEVVYPDGTGEDCHGIPMPSPPYYQSFNNRIYWFVYGYHGTTPSDFSLYKLLHGEVTSINQMLIDSGSYTHCLDTHNPVPSVLNWNTLFQKCVRVSHDKLDPGGIGEHFHYHSLNKELGGYLLPHQIGTADHSGEYIIDVLELHSDGVKELKVPILGNKIFYYLEYRRPIGFDALNESIGNYTNGNGESFSFINSNQKLPDGVQIRLRYEDTGDGSEHLMSSKYINQTNHFYDPYRGIRISLIERNDTAAKVFVEHGVFDTVPPSVQITSPSNNQQFSTTFTATATASDDFHVDKVEFHFNGNLVKTILDPPYTTNVNLLTTLNGNYNLTAKAVDLAGNSNNHTINIRVQHPSEFVFPTVNGIKISNFNGRNGEWFGKYASDISGNIGVIGSPKNYTSTGFWEGVAHVYKFNGFEWQELKILEEPIDSIENAYFGSSTKISGNLLFIGAENTDNPLYNFTTAGSGAVYVYEYNGTDYYFAQKLTSSGTAQSALGSRFGANIDADGDILAIGSPSGTIGERSVYIFKYNNINDLWEEKQRLIPQNQNGLYGENVAISGNFIAISSSNYPSSNQNGTVYIYEYNGDNQIWEAKQVINGGDKDYLSSVDIEGDTMIIGAPRSPGLFLKGRVDIYSYDGNSWIKIQNITSPLDKGFGNSVSIKDGIIVVGEKNNPDLGAAAGSAYVYEYNGSQWVQKKRLIGMDVAGGDQFGYSVVTDGENAIIGSPYDDNIEIDSGSVYIFRGINNSDESAPESPNLILPVGSELLYGNIAFDWEDSSDENGVIYQLQVDNDFDFSSPEINEVGLEISEFQFSGFLDSGSYFWKVRAADNIGNVGEWSEVRSFVIGEIVCGNYIVEESELCDDGNLIDGDGCNSICQIEPNQCNTDADSNCDGNVDSVELQSYVVDYYIGEASIGEVSEAIAAYFG